MGDEMAKKDFKRGLISLTTSPEEISVGGCLKTQRSGQRIEYSGLNPVPSL